MILVLFTSQARSLVLDSAWTQLVGVEWRTEGLKLITNINRSCQFRIWVMLRSVRLVVKFARNSKIVAENYKTSPKSANVSSESTNFRWNLLWFSQIRLNPTKLGQDLVGFGRDLTRSSLILPNVVGFRI